MKIKDVIAQTDLTDRAIRLYIENGLVTPSFNENYKGRKNIDFSQEDVEKLKNIATLRKAGFSIAEIKLLKEGSEECRRVLSAFIAKTAERIEADKEIINSLQAVVKEDNLSIETICRRLNTPTTQKYVPNEDLEVTDAERTERNTFLSVAIIGFILFVIIYVFYIDIIKDIYSFLYPTFDSFSYIKLGVSVCNILVCAYLFFRYINIKRIKFTAKQKIVSTVLSISMIPLILGHFLLSCVGCLTPTYYSETTNPDNYLVVDNYVKEYNRDINTLFPPDLPIQIIPSFESDEHADTVKYYYRCHYDGFNDDDYFDVFAEWKLDELDFYQEIYYHRNLIINNKPAVEKVKGNWICLYYADTNETDCHEHFYSLIFAYNKETLTVRYIAAYNDTFKGEKENEPYYLSLDWS